MAAFNITRFHAYFTPLYHNMQILHPLLVGKKEVSFIINGIRSFLLLFYTQSSWSPNHELPTFGSPFHPILARNPALEYNVRARPIAKGDAKGEPMPQPKHLDPGRYSSEGGCIGALLIHGFTGSVAETRPMAEYLTAHDLTVRCPLLPGHGTSAQDLTRIHWQEWTSSVESELCTLLQTCDAVFVGGLSLGALLTLWLGSRYEEIAGLIPMAPAVEVRNRMMPLALGLRHLLKYNPLGLVGDADLGDPTALDRIWCYDKLPLWGAAEVYLLQRQVLQVLTRIRQPILIFQGQRDRQLTERAAQLVYDQVSSLDKRLVWLENSGHNLLADGERETVWAQSYEWMMAHAADGAGGVGS